MKLSIQSPKQALKPFLKQKPLRSEIDAFKVNLITLLDKIKVIEGLPQDESEEHLKNDIRDFLRDTYYKDSNAINTKDKKDLVIHNGKTTNSSVGVMIEAKRPSNKGEMITEVNANKKALHELVLYYMNERIGGNNELKQLVVTNINEWYIIDANWFDKHIYRNAAIKKLYDVKIADKKDNPFFYEEVKKILDRLNIEIPCVNFDITKYDTILRNNKKEDDRELIALFKILSPLHLLKIASPNDSNSLNDKFYKELLHIIGLEEVKEGGKNIIRRKKENRHPASLIESTIDAIATEDVLHRLPDPSLYGTTQPERIYNVALELCITWMNRILFLKLLEGQLNTYHRGNKDYRFLNSDTINDFDELFKLFHKVLAVNVRDRADVLKPKYAKVPYLNSSLFEISELEDQTIKINALDNNGQLELSGTTVLKELKKKAKTLPTLQYLFTFLDAYDFASEGKEDIQEESKDLINASVLGKIFEKINGYKDGSIFTPGYITMNMCRQSIRQAVVQKFNEAIATKGETMFDSYEDVKNYSIRYYKIEDILRLNKIINSLRICDIAVGSGHFLVSALNEIIVIKSDLGILSDEKGNAIGIYEIEIVNDELVVNDKKYQQELTYEIVDGKYPSNLQIQTLQKTLFHEKQQLIENCLFGVDINPNSVKICRLRLWIELLKNAYYREETDYMELETLPNIDINIKCGNSLLSRFTLDADLTQSLKNIKYTVKEYRDFVYKYKNEKNRDAKRELQKIISSIKNDLVTQIRLGDPRKKRLDKLLYDLYYRFSGNMLFEDTPEYGNKKKIDPKVEKKKIEEEVKVLETELEEIKANAIYKGAFEWRFEFPEVLDDEGKFLGFDVVVANPPYIRQEELSYIKTYLESRYKVFCSGGDIFFYFYELCYNILKQNGTFSFINNTFDKTSAGKVLRKFLVNNVQIVRYIDFTSVVVFDEATTYPIIFQAIKTKEAKSFKYLKFTKDNFENKGLLYDENAFTSIEQSSLNSSNWNFLNQNEQDILIKINKHKPLIELYGKCYYGIKTGLNEAFVIDKKLGNCPFIHKVYEGKDIKKWSTFDTQKQMIVIESKSTKKEFGNLGEDAAFKKMKEKYPLLMGHLVTFKQAAIDRYDKGEYWWELRNCAYYDLFKKTKIIFPNLQNANKFCLDTNGNFINAPAVFLPTDDKSLLAILNSRLVWHFLKSICVVRSGGFIEVKPQYFEQIPVPQLLESQKQSLIELVNKILSAKKQNKDTIDLEREIDKMVYTLYGLTEEEIKIIKG